MYKDYKKAYDRVGKKNPRISVTLLILMACLLLGAMRADYQALTLGIIN